MLRLPQREAVSNLYQSARARNGRGGGPRDVGQSVSARLDGVVLYHQPADQRQRLFAAGRPLAQRSESTPRTLGAPVEATFRCVRGRFFSLCS